ncbi:hypothetical protein IHI24_000541 [Rickettsia endosymbiont of Cardiosporidium cionae]|nr:hypothetical protein IHI24_000541 [Rickettsia endosymbiont of Cardiosporidium cionae]
MPLDNKSTIMILLVYNQILKVINIILIITRSEVTVSDAF